MILRSSLLALLLAITLPTAADEPPATMAGDNGAVYQLRIYQIFDHNKAAFHARFRDHALPIMQRYQFHIIATWETKHAGQTEFAYLLVWPDEATMKRQWAAFLVDEEWKEIKRRTAKIHGDLVGEIEDRVLALTPYSPVKSLAN